MKVGDRVWRYGPGGPIGTVTRVDYISANVHWDDQAPDEDDDLLQKDRLQVVTESEWARRVGEIQADVERLQNLNEEMAAIMGADGMELAAYRAAVAALRKTIGNPDCGDIGPMTRHVLNDFLDKLPKEASE